MKDLHLVFALDKVLVHIRIKHVVIFVQKIDFIRVAVVSLIDVVVTEEVLLQEDN
jgi:hypothetical protein